MRPVTSGWVRIDPRVSLTASRGAKTLPAVGQELLVAGRRSCGTTGSVRSLRECGKTTGSYWQISVKPTFGSTNLYFCTKIPFLLQTNLPRRVYHACCDAILRCSCHDRHAWRPAHGRRKAQFRLASIRQRLTWDRSIFAPCLHVRAELPSRTKLGGKKNGSILTTNIRSYLVSPLPSPFLVV